VPAHLVQVAAGEWNLSTSLGQVVVGLVEQAVVFLSWLVLAVPGPVAVGGSG
jgi:hypothetical protein